MSMAEDLCEHIRPGEWPFQNELVLDEHLGPTDALMRCRHCGRTYLLEMLDWQGGTRVMRVAAPDAAEADRMIRDLSRGSCDVQRAGAQVQHMKSRAPFSRRLLLVDTGGPTLEGVATLPDDVKVPAASWRALPCDGAWVDYARSKIEMVNG